MQLKLWCSPDLIENFCEHLLSLSILLHRPRSRWRLTTSPPLLLQVKYSVVWRFPHDPPGDVPPNVRLLEWVPQQDLLSHPNTRLFITHCGANSQFEALYHAVPMIGMPLFAEQHYNARRAEYHGFGVTFNILDFTVDQMVRGINGLIANTSYRDNIRKASGVFRAAQMAPQDKATWWIEHVIQHGGSHLRSYSLDMPWYQFLMLDVLVFVLLVAILAVVVVWKTCAVVIGLVSQSNKTKRD